MESLRYRQVHLDFHTSEHIPGIVAVWDKAHWRAQRLKVTTGQSLGEVFDLYFNRTYEHFSSHQHTPYQPQQRRHVLHLLPANTINRGGPMKLFGGNLVAETKTVEVIEDLVPLHNIEVQVRLPQAGRHVTLEPQGQAIEFEQAGGVVSLCVPEFTCHQMVVFQE